MSQKTRILIAIVTLVVLVGAVLGADALRRAMGKPAEGGGAEPTLAPGSIPIRVDGRLVGSFNPADLEQMEKTSFTDAEEGKAQEGWMLRDVLRLHVQDDQLQANSLITVSSSSRAKSAQLTWAEVDEPANWVMFDLSSGRGTLKLVSVLDRLDTRDEWVQDVDSIEITRP